MLSQFYFYMNELKQYILNNSLDSALIFYCCGLGQVLNLVYLPPEKVASAEESGPFQLRGDQPG